MAFSAESYHHIHIAYFIDVSIARNNINNFTVYEYFMAGRILCERQFAISAPFANKISNTYIYRRE